MAEFIGARISLVSNSDIRYVGTLHEINSETSTVALENVSMLGTEGRRPDNEVAPLNSIYEYILFRGTDVKDLRIEEAPTTKDNKTQQIHHDPAILGSRSRAINPVTDRPLAGTQGLQNIPQAAPTYGQPPQYPSFYPPPAIWGRGGPPGLGGFPSFPYGVPPNWHPGSQQGFPPAPQFLQYGYHPVPPNQFPPQQSGNSSRQSPISANKSKQASTSTQKPEKNSGKQVEVKKTLPQPSESAVAQVKKPVPAPTIKKPNPAEVKTAILSATLSKDSSSASKSDAGQIVSGSFNIKSHIQPALPLPSLTSMKDITQSISNNTLGNKLTENSASLRGATEAAAAVTAAMAKLPKVVSNVSAADILATKVNEMGIGDSGKISRQLKKSNIGTGKSNRGGSSSGPRVLTTKVEVPAEDFDFESANAKFSKHDVIKEAKAGSTPGEKPLDYPTSIKDPPVSYNKAKSFFDNISSEAKDRQEAGNTKLGGREWRGEEQRRNLETFGQESVDNSSRGGYRSRGRGRGRGGFRGRGYQGKRPSGRGSESLQNRCENPNRHALNAVS